MWSITILITQKELMPFLNNCISALYDQYNNTNCKHSMKYFLFGSRPLYSTAAGSEEGQREKSKTCSKWPGAQESIQGRRLWGPQPMERLLCRWAMQRPPFLFVVICGILLHSAFSALHAGPINFYVYLWILEGLFPIWFWVRKALLQTEELKSLSRGFVREEKNT